MNGRQMNGKKRNSNLSLQHLTLYLSLLSHLSMHELDWKTGQIQ